MAARLRQRSRRRRLEEIAAFRQIDGWLTDAEALGLFDLAAGLPKGAAVVEIGCWKGKSTFCLASGLRSGKVFSIDPFDASGEDGSAEIYGSTRGDAPLKEQFERNLSEFFTDGRVTALPGLSSEFVGRFERIDLLFIDGDHSVPGCRFDFESFSPAVNDGGFVAFHDYDPARPDLGPTWVVENLVLGNDRWRPALRADSLWVCQKRSST
ncbi:class I SAM-dependent methyltransferase [Alienimonas sp. DA493]|uniref:class I SAM-dependent methyltransferase n=1 Tax=Alienimonas sp. DA493 TaxID=3373605 RepID=UPI003754853E